MHAIVQFNVNETIRSKLFETSQKPEHEVKYWISQKLYSRWIFTNILTLPHTTFSEREKKWKEGETIIPNSQLNESNRRNRKMCQKWCWPSKMCTLLFRAFSIYLHRDFDGHIECIYMCINSILLNELMLSHFADTIILNMCFESISADIVFFSLSLNVYIVS